MITTFTILSYTKEVVNLFMIMIIYEKKIIYMSVRKKNNAVI